MKRTALFFLGTLVCLASCTSQTFNEANAVTRDVKDFHAVEVSSGIDLYLTQSNSETVAVSASDPEYRDKIQTVVENGVLKIYYDNDNWKFWKNSGNKRLKAYVSIVNIDGLDVSAGASAKIQGTVKSPKLHLEINSGGSVDGALDVQDLKVEQSSGSVATITGKAGSLSVEGSSGSVFKGYDLQVENCNADMSSGGGVQITVNKELSAAASSGGYIHYKGTGVIRNISSSSGGSISKKS